MMFQVGESVVYGGNGICEIREISTIDMPGIPKDRLYYVLSPSADVKKTVYVPVENPKLVIRRLMSKEDAMALIEETPQIETIVVSNEKLREETYKGCMKTCESKEWVRIIKTIYERKQERLHKGKKITAIDERYMKMAEDHLYSELSAVLDIPKNDVPAFIGEKIGTGEHQQ